MSASRVENADDMAVDDAEVALPTAEWLQAAQRAAETDGILENTSAKRQKVRNASCTLMSLQMQTLHTNAHKGESTTSRADQPFSWVDVEVMDGFLGSHHRLLLSPEV